MSNVPKPRIPGVSITHDGFSAVDVGNGIISEKVVVCCPVSCASEISAVLRLMPGMSWFKSVLFPTPLLPLNSVTFSGCGARYLYLSGCTLKNCLLERCMCAGGGLISLKLQKTIFDGCDFTGCDFRSTDLAGCDLSGCTIEGCTWTPERLKNLTVNMQQALELARLLGLNIIP